MVLMLLLYVMSPSKGCGYMVMLPGRGKMGIPLLFQPQFHKNEAQIMDGRKFLTLNADYLQN